jgi:streptogramin lyase
LASGSSIAGLPPFAEEWFVPAAPQDVEVDPSGLVWVSCADDSIRVYTPRGGDLLYAFGGRGTGDGEFLTPFGIAFDPSGDAYICDYEGARVEKFTNDGQFLLSWPVPSTRSDHVAVDAAGDVYVTGYEDASVHKYSSTGDGLLDWPSASENLTAGVVVVGGTVSVVLWTSPDVEQYDTDGTYLGSFSAETVNGVDIESDALDQFWVSDFGGHTIGVFSSLGDPLEVSGTFGAGPGEFNGPSGLALGTEGSVYVADQGNGRIQRFGDSTTGVTVPLAGLPSLMLQMVAPNPCRSAVEFTYSASGAEHVRLTVADVRGRIVATVDDRVVAAGLHRVAWTPTGEDGTSLASGVYLSSLSGGGQIQTKRLVVLK